jgi:DNA-binding NarL/FixJ family response regulator
LSASTLPIVLVDDHSMVLLGLRTLFHRRRGVEVVAYAHAPQEALEACREHQPRVAVIDYGLAEAEVDGLELCRRLQDEVPGLECVVYTSRDEPGLAQRAFAAGAKGVVSKSESPADLVRAVLLAGRGKNYISPASAERAYDGDPGELTRKQVEVLQLLADGLERKQIAERMGIGEETVKTHLAEARRRLGARTSAQAVAIGVSHSLLET